MNSDDRQAAQSIADASRETDDAAPRLGILLVARAAVGAAPLVEMAHWVAAAAATHPAAMIAFGFIEQGAPSVRSAMADLRRAGVDEILIVPLLLPFEPSLRNSLARMIARWRRIEPGGWPQMRIGAGWAPETGQASALLDLLIGSASIAEPLQPELAKAEGSLVPAQRHRVLVCAGGPCTQAGALMLWGHLRSRQDEWGLRHEGDGMMSCRTTCLGPCALAPVMQVWPDGATYGGLDEAGVDAILINHVQGGAPFEALRYRATGHKQRLRTDSGATVRNGRF